MYLCQILHHNHQVTSTSPSPPLGMRRPLQSTPALPHRLVTLLVTLSVVLFGVLVHVHKKAVFSIPKIGGGEADMPDQLSRVVDTNKLLREKAQRARQLAQEREQKERMLQQQMEEDAKRPPMNILLFYADDWRHDTMGAAGNPIVKTPFIDALAKEGVRFSQNCVTTSICWISRATLYTGQYLARHHFEMLGRGRTLMINDQPTPMNLEVPANETLYSLLKHKANYYVGHSGKLGLWIDAQKYLGRDTFDFFTDEDGWHWRDLGGGKLVHITNKNTGDALRFLKTWELKDKNPSRKPFFLNVAYFATHAVDGDVRQYMPQNESMSMYENDTIPIPATGTDEAWMKMPYFFRPNNEARTRWKWRYDEPNKHQTMMKNYYRMASEVDTSVGIILKELEIQGQLNNTLIIFTTDNGNFHSEHGLADKWYPHQESIRVPLVIKDPRMSPEFVGTTNEDFTLNIDLTATILAAAGLDPLPTMMGRDMSVLYRKNGFDGEVAAKTSQSRRKTFASTNGRNYINPASDGGGMYHSGSESSWRTEFFYEHPMHSSPDYIPASEALVRKVGEILPRCCNLCSLSCLSFV